MCVGSRASGLSFCHGHTFDPVYRIAVALQKKEVMPVRSVIDFDCAFDGDENHMINYGCEIVGMSEIHEQILSQYTEILDSEDEEI